MVRHSWLAPVIFILMTAAAGVGYKRPELPRQIWESWFSTQVDSSKTLPAQSPDVEASRRRSQQGRRGRDQMVATSTMFSSDVMMIITCDDFFKPAEAKAIREVVNDLQQLPQVSHITWIENAPPLNIFGLPEPVLPDHRASAEKFKQAKSKAMRSPMIAGQLLSRDGTALLLLLEMDWFYVRADTDCSTRLLQQFESTLIKHPSVKMTAGVTGSLPMSLRIGEKNAENDRKFQWVVYFGVLLMAAILFRGLSAVLIAALPAAVGTFWAFGFFRFLDMQENPFNYVVVPVLLSMVGFTDSVHLVTHIRSFRAKGLSVHEATLRSFDDVGGACFLTSLTTAIGFASLRWAHHDIVKEFGLSCVIGVVVMFIAVITTIPIACRTWLGRGLQRGEVGGWIERNFHRIMPWLHALQQRPRLVSAIAILLTTITAVATLQLEPDERMFTGIPEASPEAIALRQMDLAFGGLEMSTVRVQWPTDNESSYPEVVQVCDEIESILRGEKLLGSPLGLASIVNALPGNAGIAEKASLVELLPPQLKQVFWNPAYQQATIYFRLQDIGIARYGEVFGRILPKLESIEKQHPGINVVLGGSAVWRCENLYRIVLDLAKSLGTASFVIFGVLAIFYRSLRLGLIAVIPNLFPLTLTGAVMWLMGQPLELVSVLAFTVCLGIAVDDTIHFLTRYREELELTDNVSEAIHNAMLGVGAAMTMTTVVLLAGFSTVLMSDSREHHLFALMGGGTIGTAIIGDLIFLPALLQWLGKPATQNKNADSE